MKKWTILILVVLFFVLILIRVNKITKENKVLQEMKSTDSYIQKEKANDIGFKETTEEESVIYEMEAPLFDPNVNIVDRINNYLVEDKEHIGFIYYNFKTGEKIAFNENNIFEAASTYKVGLNLVCYDIVQKGQISLEDEVYYNCSQYQEGAGILQFENNLTSLPLQTILDYSIIYSDNIAATMAFDYIGGWNNYRNKVANLVGIENIKYKNITTPENEFKVLKYLYDNRENQNDKHLIETMKQTIFHDRLDKYLPYDKVAHKIGDMNASVHDMGIVYSEKPYMIIILTDGVYDSYDKIANLSKAMYLYNSNKTSFIEIE